MNILGITHPISFNTAAAILVDGELVATAEEERFNRIRYAPRMIPENAVKFVLEKANLKENDIQIIAVSWNPATTFANYWKSYLKGLLSNKWTPAHEAYFWAESIRTEKELMKYLKTKFSNAKIYRVDHHLTHMASSVFLSGFKDSLFLTLDGRGEFESGLLGEFRNNKLDVFRSIKVKESLGILYEEFTSLIGFRRHMDEGKVMGLAPYGKPIESLFNLVNVDKNYNIKIDWKAIKQIDVGQLADDPTKDKRKDLAATVQFLLENTTLKLVENLKENSDSKRICLAGGVALNIDMNSKILNSGYFNDIFIQPASSDAGCALGAAAYAYFKETGETIKTKMGHAYWGAEYANDEIETVLKKLKVKNYSHLETSQIPGTIAELISKDNIIAWFQGRFELGPRALGSRSFLANPTKVEMWKTMNQVKGREYWRPLAPSILEEEADKLLENSHNSEFMLLSFVVKDDKIPLIPAVTHVDKTTRPQTVSKKTNELYWSTIKEFEKITSVPLVINTSLNLRGEPIANTPEDCIKTFFGSGTDHTIIGNYLLSKKQ